MFKSLKELSLENRLKRKQAEIKEKRSIERQNVFNATRNISNDIKYTLYIIVPYYNYQTTFFVLINNDNTYLLNILNNTKYLFTYVKNISNEVSEEIMKFIKKTFNTKFIAGDSSEYNYYETLIYDDIFTKKIVDSSRDDDDHPITSENFNVLYFLTGINDVYNYVRNKTFI